MRVDLKNFFLSLLIYSPTLVLIPQSIVYVLICLIGLISFIISIKTNNLKKPDIFLLLIVIYSFILYFIGKFYVLDLISKSINDLIPYLVFLLFTIFFSKLVTVDILKYLFYFILIEVGVGYLEFFLGKPFLINPDIISGETEFGSTDLLYYNRVFGLSPVLSIYAQKIFIGVLLLFFINLRKGFIFLLFYLMIAFLTNLNRTALFSSLIFLSFYSLNNFNNFTVKIKFLFFTVLFFFLILIFYFSDLILIQLLRGNDVVDLTGREEAFNFYIEFIKNNFWFGNYGHKLWAVLTAGKIFHAHNSFLQTLANLGIIFSFFIFSYIYLFINKINYIFIIPILIYSIFQYGILWGVSFLDIIFFSILFLSSKNIHHNNHVLNEN